MASGTFYPAASADDGYWTIAGGTFRATQYRCLFGYSTDHYGTFIRFNNVTIPQGATIDSAFVRLTACDTLSADTCNVNIYFNNEDDATNPADVASADAKTVTAKIDWDAVPHFTDGTTYDTPELKTILQTVIDRGGFSSGNHILFFIKEESESVGTTYRNISAFDHLGGAEKAELHVTWSVDNEKAISEDVNVLSEFDDNFGIVAEAASINAGFVFFDTDSPISENTSVNSEITYSEPDSPISDDVSVNSVFGCLVTNSPISEEASVNADFISEYAREFSENASVNVGIEVAKNLFGELSEEASVSSAFIVQRYISKTIADTLSSWGILKWGWNKTIADSLAIADTASKILGIPVKDWLTITDTEITNWNGIESISDSLYAVDISKAIQVYEDLIADGMAIVDAVKIALELIITDILTCTDTIVNTGTFQHSIEDGMTLEDIARRLFPKSVADSFVATDISLVDFLALLQISDSFNAVDTASRLLTINKTIADSLEALDTVTVQQLIQELIQDGLNIEVSVVIDGEVWECWCLNCSSFYPSVYSNYNYNSFAIDKQNNIVYGAKSDGIYRLDGDDDNGTPIRTGIILPSTQFGSAHNKRFRAAFFGVNGDDVILKAETDNGYRTYRVTDAEVRLTRDLKGRAWQFSIENFEALDMIELFPVVLSRK